MSKKVLVFPSSSEIGEEIASALNLNKEFELVPCLSNKTTEHGIYLPDINDESFKKELIKLIKLYSIDVVYPAHDLFIDWIAINRKDIPAKIVLEDSIIVNLVRSKTATYQFFSDSLNVPKVFNKKNIKDGLVDFPLFAKPDRGFGSVQSQIVDNKIDLMKYINDKKFVVTEYLPGKEYTIDCVSDSSGKLLVSCARKREEIRNGICKNTSIIDHSPSIADMARVISEKLKIKGAWFFQVKENKYKQPCLLEIAPRISGNTALLRANGVNSVLLSLYIIAENQNISIAKFSAFESMRRPLNIRLSPSIKINTIYMDLDDTIIFNNLLVPESIAILVKAQNLGIKNVLITRHSGDIDHTLSSFKITHLFDEVHQLTDRMTRKSAYIKSKQSIFIDDSHKERLEVHQKMGIPVFSTDMLQLLMQCISNL